MSNLISRAAFIGKLIATREGRQLLSAAADSKSLTASVMTELVAGSAWFQGLPLSKIGDFDSYLKAATKRVWALWTCCDLIAEAACAQPHTLRRKRGKVSLEVTNSELENLLEEPNEWQTWRDLKYQTLMQLLITGNAFWAKDEANQNGDKPTRLVPLNPKRVSIILDVRNGVIGYVYRPQYAQDHADFSQPIPFNANQVIHFRKPNPDNDFWGLGAVESAEPLFNDFLNEDTWRQEFWRRGALPTTLLTLKAGVGGQATSIPEAKWKQMKEQWEHEYGGTSNAGKTAWLSGDWQVQRMGLSLAEMQSIEGRRWTIEQIAHQFKVPLSVLGLDSSANYATANIDRRRFLECAVLPTLKNYEQRVNKDLVHGYDRDLNITHNVSGLVALDELAAPLQTLIGNSVLTPNEAREVIGKEREDDPAMDRFYMTSGLTPLELNGVADLGGVDAAAQRLQQRVTRQQIGAPKPGLEEEEFEEEKRFKGGSGSGNFGHGGRLGQIGGSAPRDSSAEVEVAGRKLQFVLSPRSAHSGDVMVMADVGKLDAAFRKDNDAYIGQGGSGNIIGNRYPRFQDFMRRGEPIETSEVTFKPDGGVAFINGRHRFAVLRDSGASHIPVAVAKESLRYAIEQGHKVVTKTS